MDDFQKTRVQLIEELNALRESQRRFREFFDEAPVAYHELKDHGRNTRINHTELNMLGYSLGETLGRPI